MPRKPAAFALCKTCGEHGHFVFSDGSKGPEFNSKEEIVVELARFRAEGTISREQQLYMIERTMSALSLPDVSEEAGGIFQLVCFLMGRDEEGTIPDGPSNLVH